MDKNKVLKKMNGTAWKWSKLIEPINIYVEINKGSLQDVYSDNIDVAINVHLIDYDSDDQQELPDGLYLL